MMKNTNNTTMNTSVIEQRGNDALPVILGIDHGYGNIKTASFCFRTSVDHYEARPELARHVLEYSGHFFAIGEGHKEYRSDKMNDDDYYLLTLAAIARELNFRRVTAAAVYVAAGLPLTWLGSQKETFRQYLLRNDCVSFRFDGKDYNLGFTGADIFPQGFAAVADKFYQFRGQNMIADIGNGTMNIMFVNERRPVAKQCFTESCGVNQCLLKKCVIVLLLKGAKTSRKPPVKNKNQGIATENQPVLTEDGKSCEGADAHWGFRIPKYR